jgi:4-hydroxy-4-methyl-2-oxoglutarate aldolase
MTQLGVVVTGIAPVNTDWVNQLKAFGVATVHEALGRTGLMNANMRPAFVGASMAGRAITALLQPGDNWMLHVAAEQIEPGDVVVAACTSPCSDGMFGDLLATSYQARGCAGLVIDAGVRDVQTLQGMPFAVFSTAIHSKGTVKATLGSVNVPVVCAGALVNPGDVVVADVDGVVVVPARELEQTVSRCQIRADAEVAKRKRLASGELGLDLYNMRPTLQAAGLRYLPLGKTANTHPN